jgi:hypothetical protein
LDVNEATNPAFIYRTETVGNTSASVPLIDAVRTITETSDDTLQAAANSMLDAMRVAPANSQGDHAPAQLRIEGSVSYSFQLLDGETPQIKTFIPLYLMELGVLEAASDSGVAATQAADIMSKWFKATKPNVDHSAISFQLTIFATMIGNGSEELPLVQYHDISIPVPPNDPDWW